MTMVPAENTSKQNHLLPRGGSGGDGFDFYGCFGSNYTEKINFGLMSRLQGCDYQSEACLGSDLDANYHMAEDASRTNSVNETGSSSKDYNQGQEDRDHEGWLQLSIGGHATTRHHHNKHDQVDLAVTRGRGLTELHLLPGGASSQQERPHGTVEFQAPLHPLVMQGFTTSLFLKQQQQQQRSTSMFHHAEISRAFRPIAAAPSSYFARPFQVQPEPDVAGPSSDVRIIDPPRRPRSGIWFMLQASENQAKEPFLPQIPKSYLRIKDGKMTIRSVMKYIVNKLRLDSESEVEIRCRGEELEHYLTLQQVRDQIWTTSRNDVTLLPRTSTPHHHLNLNLNLNLMLLHYGRKA